MRRRQIPVYLFSLMPLLAPLAGQAQAPSPAAWYTVRPGESLEAIAARFLGSSQRWQEIRRLNPEIADPNRIEPGLRIRMPEARPAIPVARLSRLSRKVEAQPSPINWKDARLGEVLVERDGVRTHQKASAEMQFTDGDRLVMTEDSLVFLRRTGAALKGVERKSIEIVDGQADLEGRAGGSRAGAPEVEIILGGTRATSKPGPAGVSQARARKAEGGGAKVMVYGGEGEVEAGGARVQVAQGMGTSVEAQGPPSPPEKLLPAPRLAEPASGAERACADPVLSWEAVPEAASYTVEVCRDAGCGELVERQTGLAEARWRATGLPVGELFWRVTARSRSGLDGYPSEAVRLRITSSRAGLPAPAGALNVTGPQLRVGERLFVLPGAKVEVAGTDAARWAPVIGGREASAWPAVWPAGEQTVSASVQNGCGQQASLAPVSFVVDGEAPVIRWEAGGRETFEERLAVDTEKDRRRLRGRRGQGEPAEDAWASEAGVWQVPLPWVKTKAREARPEARASQLPVVIASDRPQAFLATPGTEMVQDGKVTPLDGGILWIAAEDGGAGVDRLTLRTRPEGETVVLEVEVSDLLGNVAQQQIVLRRATQTARR